MLTVPAKHILSQKHKGSWYGPCWNANLYRGCCHGCIYCDSRSECYGIEDFDTVRAKENALAILEQELRAKRTTGLVAVGAMTDSYNPFEEKERLTRGALELYERYGFGAAIDTKSPLVARDGDVLRSIMKHAPAAVSFTITCADDALSRRVEQNVAPTGRRLDALSALAAQGIPCGVLLMPILPFINDTEENLLSLLRMAKEAGAKWAFSFGVLGVTLRGNQRLHFLTRAEEQFPGVKQRYISAYGDRYECPVPDHRRLVPLVIKESERLGLLWRAEDIAALVQSPYDPSARQMSLF